MKKAEKLVAQEQEVKDSQRKAAQACEAEVVHLTKVDRDSLSAEDLIKLEQELKQAMGVKKKIEEESKREVERRVGDKKEVVNGNILKRVRIVVAYMNPIDRSSEAELETAGGKTSKLLDKLARTNRTLG